MISKREKYEGGTYAHPDIALEFASWLDTSFKLYLIKEFERLKEIESYQEDIEWNIRRSLSKTNYRIHTDSIKENIYPTLTKKQRKFCYSNESDVLNVALFGKTAKEWKVKKPNIKGNIRDYANILQLVVLSNLKVINAKLIHQGINQQERLDILNKTAIRQLEILWNDNNITRKERRKMKETYEFLKVKTQVNYVATINKDRPSCRPFGDPVLFDNKIYILTNKQKNVSKQIAENNHVCIVAYDEENWIRIDCELVDDSDNIEAKKAIIKEFDWAIDAGYTLDNPDFQALYISNATSTILDADGNELEKFQF